MQSKEVFSELVLQEARRCARDILPKAKKSLGMQDVNVWVEINKDDELSTENNAVIVYDLGAVISDGQLETGHLKLIYSDEKVFSVKNISDDYQLLMNKIRWTTEKIIKRFLINIRKLLET